MSSSRDEILEQLKRARKMKSSSEIAAESGIPYGTLTSFVSRGYLGKKYCAILDAYLSRLLPRQVASDPTIQCELDWYRSGRIFAATSGLPGEANNIEVIYQCDSVGTVLGETLGEFYDRKIKGKESPTPTCGETA